MLSWFSLKSKERQHEYKFPVEAKLNHEHENKYQIILTHIEVHFFLRYVWILLENGIFLHFLFYPLTPFSVVIRAE